MGAPLPKWFIALIFITALAGGPAFAQEGQASGPPSSTDDGAAGQLPVSLDRIKQALEQPPAEPLRGLDERPHFRVQIQERQKFDEMLNSLKVDSGPAVPGGLYGYQQQQIVFPSVQNPYMQPYSAFTQGQLTTIAVENLLEQYFGPRLMQQMTAASRAQAEQAARAEVERVFAQFCSTHDCSQP